MKHLFKHINHTHLLAVDFVVATAYLSLSLSLSLCACVRACARARVCVCVCYQDFRSFIMLQIMSNYQYIVDLLRDEASQWKRIDTQHLRLALNDNNRNMTGILKRVKNVRAKIDIIHNNSEDPDQSVIALLEQG